MDSWQVLRKIRPAETAHTVIATVDGELNEWTDTDLTAGDRRYKVVAVRDSLTSRRSRVAKLVLDEPPPLRPTPSTITQVPEKELLTEKAAGDACISLDSVTVTVGPGGEVPPRRPGSGRSSRSTPVPNIRSALTASNSTNDSVRVRTGPGRRGGDCKHEGKLRDRNVGPVYVAQLHAVGRRACTT